MIATVAVAGDDGRRTRWSAHRDRRRDDFVRAAIAAVRRHGDGASMEQIAAEAGVSKAVLYRHVRDRADLHAAVGQELAGHVRRVVAAALDQAQPLRLQVHAAVDAYLRLIESEQALYRFVHRRLGAVADYTELMGRLVAGVLEARLAGPVDPDTAATWGHAVVGMVHAAGDRWLESGGGHREQLSAQLAALAWGGLAQVAQP
jgi:AcrR family transcriptional regulator